MTPAALRELRHIARQAVKERDYQRLAGWCDAYAERAAKPSAEPTYATMAERLERPTWRERIVKWCMG